VELLHNLANNSEFPLLAAFTLGLITAVSPCPLATNITAVGFISQDVNNRRRVFVNGLWYTLGRTISYTLLGIIIIMLIKQGASTFKVQKAISSYGEMLLGPFMLITGIFLSGILKLQLPGIKGLTQRFENSNQKNNIGFSFLLGLVFALAFCPYSGILYFGILIPLSVSVTSGYFLPPVFAIATGLPVILFAWIIAFSIKRLAGIYNNMKTFEKWFRKIVAVAFILTGLYYIWIIYIR
jgi:cytochrome c-type biogenesis protein